MRCRGRGGQGGRGGRGERGVEGGGKARVVGATTVGGPANYRRRPWRPARCPCPPEESTPAPVKSHARIKEEAQRLKQGEQPCAPRRSHKASLMNTRADQHATARCKLSLRQPQLQSAVAFHRAEQFTGHARIVQPNRHRALPVHLTKNTYRPRTARAVAIDAQHAIADLCRKRALRQQPEGIAFAGLHRGTLQPDLARALRGSREGYRRKAADTYSSSVDLSAHDRIPGLLTCYPATTGLQVLQSRCRWQLHQLWSLPARQAYSGRHKGRCQPALARA